MRTRFKPSLELSLKKVRFYQNKHGEIAKLLINTTGVDADATQNDGFSPLHYAASVGLTEVIELLLSHQGVDVNRSFFVHDKVSPGFGSI